MINNNHNSQKFIVWWILSWSIIRRFIMKYVYTESWDALPSVLVVRFLLNPSSSFSFPWNCPFWTAGVPLFGADHRGSAGNSSQLSRKSRCSSPVVPECRTCRERATLSSSEDLRRCLPSALEWAQPGWGNQWHYFLCPVRNLTSQASTMNRF